MYLPCKSECVCSETFPKNKITKKNSNVRSKIVTTTKIKIKIYEKPEQIPVIQSFYFRFSYMVIFFLLSILTRTIFDDEVSWSKFNKKNIIKFQENPIFIPYRHQSFSCFLLFMIKFCPKKKNCFVSFLFNFNLERVFCGIC